MLNLNIDLYNIILTSAFKSIVNESLRTFLSTYIYNFKRLFLIFNNKTTDNKHTIDESCKFTW